MTRSRSGSVVEASSIVWTSTKHAPIRNAIVQILEKAGFGMDEHGNEVKLERCRCPVDYFVVPLNTIIGAEVGGDMAPFTENMLRQAFAFEGNNPSSFADCRVAIGADIEGVLHVRSGWQGNHQDGKVVHDISLFSDLQSARIGCSNADADDIIPIRRIKSVNLDFISDNIQNALQKFAKKRKRRSDNDTKAAKQHEQQESNRRKRTAVESMDADVEPGTDALRMKVNDVKRRREELLAQLEAVDEEMKRSTAALNNAVGPSGGINMEGDNPSNYDYQHVDKTTRTGLTEDRTSFRYYLGGAAGVLDLVGPPPDQVLVHEDLKKGLLDPHNTSTPPDNLKMRTIAGHRYFIPPYHELVVKNRSAEKESSKTVVDGIRDLLDKDISTWSEKAKRIFTAMSTFGYGCSDEGTRFIMGGALSALFNEVGLEFEGEQVSNVVPSKDTLKKWEINLATDCLFGLCWELKEAKVTQLGITTDHGHRKGQDHLVKLLSFPSITSTGDLTIEFMCLNVDSAGHKTEEAASAISDDVSALLEILRRFVGDDVKLSVITGDAGGGASVQNLHPELQKIGTMDEWSKKLSCDLHNLNKAFEIACTSAWGGQGIGHLTPFQMIWLFVRILKHFRKELNDRSSLDEAWGTTIQYLRDNHKWQGVACEKCDIAFTDFMDRLEALENGDDDALAAALDMSSKAPANLQDPVMTRWGTILAAVRFFADNWVVIYFFAMTLANSEKSDSHLCTMCCALISLMHNTTVSPTTFETTETNILPTVDGTEIDNFVATFDSDTSILADAVKEGPSTPIFLAVIHFLDAFNEAFFGDMYNFMRMNDPFLGDGTFGQLARFGPERCSVMHTLLLELESGAWKEKAEFKRFREAYDSVAGDVERKYLDTAVGAFFSEFRRSFDKHMVAKWTSTEIVHYVLGGDPHHTKEFARWLVHHHHINNESSSDDDEDEMMVVEFAFEDKRVTLGHHHRRYRGDVALDMELNLRDSMNFMTRNVDPLDILNDPFIKRNWTHIMALADEDEETTAVDIWDKSSQASFSKYKHFREDIIRTICIHSSHQQRCENYVQLCGLISKTGVGEVRRTCRAIINSIIHRRFNLWALQRSNERRKKEGNTPVMRVQGSERMTLFQTFIDGFFKKVEKAKAYAPDLWKTVRQRLSNGSTKASNKERLNRMRTFHKSLEKAPKTVKAVQPMGIEQTVHTSNAVQLSLLTSTKNKYLPAGMSIEGILQAELDTRNLVMRAGDEKNLKAQRDAIQLHEFGRIKQRDPVKELALKQVRDIQPMSDLMKKYLADGHQNRIMDATNRRNG